MQEHKIIIVGARGMGRELSGYLLEEGYCVKGFLDGGVSPDDRQWTVPILGAPETWMPAAEERFIIALGEAAWRRHYAELLAERGARFATVVSARAFVGPNVSIGEGSIIAPTAVITSDVILGKHTILNVHTSVSHDCVAGDYVTLSPGSRIPGRCTLEDGIFLGVNASLIPDVRLAKETCVGAGAVVTRSVTETGRILTGIPARCRERHPK